MAPLTASRPFRHLACTVPARLRFAPFARTWLLELKERGIRVNILSPGPIDTAIMEHVGADTIGFLKSQIPRGELGRPEEIATAALFLASSDSSFVNGVELFVDGGMAQV